MHNHILPWRKSKDKCGSFPVVTSQTHASVGSWSSSKCISPQLLKFAKINYRIAAGYWEGYLTFAVAVFSVLQFTSEKLSTKPRLILKNRTNVFPPAQAILRISDLETLKGVPALFWHLHIQIFVPDHCCHPGTTHQNKFLFLAEYATECIWLVLKFVGCHHGDRYAWHLHRM